MKTNFVPHECVIFVDSTKLVYTKLKATTVFSCNICRRLQDIDVLYPSRSEVHVRSKTLRVLTNNRRGTRIRILAEEVGIGI